MGWQDAFDGQHYFEGVEEWAIRDLQLTNPNNESVRMVCLYIKTREGKEYRFMLGGSVPADWIKALTAVTRTGHDKDDLPKYIH